MRVTKARSPFFFIVLYRTTGRKSEKKLPFAANFVTAEKKNYIAVRTEKWELPCTNVCHNFSCIHIDILKTSYLRNYRAERNCITAINKKRKFLSVSIPIKKSYLFLWKMARALPNDTPIPESARI